MILKIQILFLKDYFSGAINPARDLGPRLFSLIMYGSEAMTSNQSFFWTRVFRWPDSNFVRKSF